MACQKTSGSKHWFKRKRALRMSPWALAKALGWSKAPPWRWDDFDTLFVLTRGAAREFSTDPARRREAGNEPPLDARRGSATQVPEGPRRRVARDGRPGRRGLRARILGAAGLFKLTDPPTFRLDMCTNKFAPCRYWIT